MADPTVEQLSNKNGSDSVLAAAKGTFILNNAVEKELKCSAIVFLEDTIISSLKEFGSETNVLSTYVAKTNIAVKTGCILRPLNGKKFGKVTFTSGSAILVI